MNGAQLLCLDEEKLFLLTDKLYGYIQEKHGKKDSEWISKEEAMQLLNCSRGTMQKLRDEMKIRFSAHNFSA